MTYGIHATPAAGPWSCSETGSSLRARSASRGMTATVRHSTGHPRLTAHPSLILANDLRRERGVRTESHALWLQARVSWRRTSARPCSYPIPYVIGARIAPDYPRRPVPSASPRRSSTPQGRPRVRRRPCWPSWNSRLPASRGTAFPRRLSMVHAGRDTGQVESGGVAPRCLISAPRRPAARVASLGRTQRSSMSTGSNGFPYQLTTSSCSS